jgi:flagellar biosynthesis/type III secretory pathway chaperone
MDVLKDWLQPLIDNFEAQSGSGDGTLTDSTLAVIRNVSSLPEPHASPISSSQANVDYLATTKKEQTRAADRERKATKSPTTQAIHSLTESIQQSNSHLIQAMQQQTNTVLEAFKVSQPIHPLPSIDWTPVMQGALTGLAKAFGAQVTFTPTTPTHAPTPTAAPASSPPDPLVAQLSQAVSQQGQTLDTLTQGFNTLNQTVTQLSQAVTQQGKTLEALTQVLAQLASNKSGSNSSNGSSSTNGSSSNFSAAPTSRTD